MCRNNEQQTTSKGETWSRGTNSRLPFDVNVKLNLEHPIFSLEKKRKGNSKASCKRTQQLPKLLPNSVESYFVRLHVAKHLTGFKLCTAICNKTQQHATLCANGRNM